MQRKKSTDNGVEINITPLIDIVFLLLIFFMLTTVFAKQQQLEIALPKTQSQSKEIPRDKIEIHINAENIITINGNEMTAEALLKYLVQFQNSTPIIIFADKESKHAALVEVMDNAALLGFSKLHIATNPQGNSK